MSHPTGPSPRLDVQPIRKDLRRWGLAVEGYRALYHMQSGSLLIEQIEPRTSESYTRFGRLRVSNPSSMQSDLHTAKPEREK